MNYERTAYDAIVESNIGHYVEMAFASFDQNMRFLTDRLSAPSTIYKPKLSVDGDQWCALYGEDLQCGVAGFGDTPALAMADFDLNWNTAPSPKNQTSTT